MDYYNGTIFAIVCVMVFVVGVPLIYLLAQCYLQELFCCRRRKRMSDYDEITDSLSSFDVIDIDRDEHFKPPKIYIVENNGYFYSRNTDHGSKHTLLGVSPTSTSNLSFGSSLIDLKNNITIDISFARMKEDRQSGIWLRVDEIHCLNTQIVFKDFTHFKFKVKIFRFKKDAQQRTVCKLESQFLTKDQVSKHVFKLHHDTNEKLDDLILRLKVRALKEKRKKAVKVGQTDVFLEELDPNGNIMVQRKTLNPDTKMTRLRGSTFSILDL